jgi:hypothetical protein
MKSEVNDEIERLIKAAQAEGPSTPLNEVERFIVEMEIIPSQHNKIANHNIYALYETWSLAPENRETFFIEFSKHFEKCNLGRPEQHRGYKIICDRIQSSIDALWKERRYYRDKKANKKKR